MIQQGQVFKLKTKVPDGQALWAYRYRLEGRGSDWPQERSSTGSGQVEDEQRSRSPSSSTSRRPDRLPDLRTEALGAGADQGRHRAATRPL